MKRNIEIISLIYKSVDYLHFIVNELKTKCFLDDWDVGIRIVANDADPKVLIELDKLDIPYTVYNDPNLQDFYLNRVYRCWNNAVETSKYDNVCLVNSDMLFSEDWLKNLVQAYDGSNIPCSRLVESGKYMSGLHGISKDFGNHPSNLQKENFETFAKFVSIDENYPGGLFMPCIFNTKLFKESKGYPPGNIFKVSENEFVAGYPNDRPVFMSGDAFFFMLLKNTKGLNHITVGNSIVYHIQEGEKDA